MPPPPGVNALRCGVTGVAQTLGLIQMLCSLNPELLRHGISGTLGERVNAQFKEDTDLTQQSVSEMSVERQCASGIDSQACLPAFPRSQ